LLMAYVHIAHNCILGSNITIANYSGLSGHVEIEDQAVLGGLTGIHQFCRIGRLAMVGGYSKVIKDIPPFVMADGQPARLFGINARGLRRRDISEKVRMDIKKAYNLFTDSKLNLSQAIEAIKKNIKPGPEIDYLLRFLQNPSRMGILIK
ncbi:MAG: acyl-[acyl-carrier-protein]--UDP-N-acetylglucosamine O-acyltransferase, partial [Firmicutes bacterium]|nr:acyl-[acyl-carrier-protein]--UDP-N-acetylglucosamine O-acyltransferase [Bacillota bacterium]